MIGNFMAFGVGLLGWSFTEYALHAWAGHYPRGKVEISREHLRHHSVPSYFSPAKKKAVLAVPVLSGVFGLGWLAGGAPVAGALTAGFATGWLAYERVHRSLHENGPRTAYGRWACRHHFHHHFTRPFMNHGVTSPLWDFVFWTYERPERVRVPRRHSAKLPWLLDDAGDLDERMSADYVLT